MNEYNFALMVENFNEHMKNREKEMSYFTDLVNELDKLIIPSEGIPSYKMEIADELVPEIVAYLPVRKKDKVNKLSIAIWVGDVEWCKLVNDKYTPTGHKRVVQYYIRTWCEGRDKKGRIKETAHDVISINSTVNVDQHEGIIVRLKPHILQVTHDFLKRLV